MRDSEGGREGWYWEISREGGREGDVLLQPRDKLCKMERVIREISRIFANASLSFFFNRNRAQPFHSREKKVSSSEQSNAVSYSS